MRFFSLFLTLALTVFLAACSTQRANTVEDSGFLGADLYKKMETNTNDDTRALRVYKSANAKNPAYMKRFTKVMLNPIAVYLQDDQLKDVGQKKCPSHRQSVL